MAHEDRPDGGWMKIQSMEKPPGISSGDAEAHVDAPLLQDAQDCFSRWNFFMQ